MRHAPIGAGGGPEGVRTDDQLAVGVELAPVVEEEGDLGELLVGERGVFAAGVVGGGVEGLGVGEGADEVPKVRGRDVGDEPGDQLGVEHDGGGEPRGEEVAGEDEVDEELEAGVVEDDVDAAVGGLVGVAGGVEHVKGGVQVVDENVLLRSLARLRALQLLDVLVGQRRQERQVRGVAPEADLAHLREENAVRLLDLLGRLAVRGAPRLLCFLRELLVPRGELEHRRTRRLERGHLLPGEHVVALPVLGHGEEGAHAPVCGKDCISIGRFR